MKLRRTPKLRSSALPTGAFADTPIYRDLILNDGHPLPFDQFIRGELSRTAVAIATANSPEPKQLTS